MIEFFDRLWVWFQILNAFTGGLLFWVLALLAATIAVSAVWAAFSRPVEELADPAYNPTLDGAYDVFEGGDDDR